MSEIKLGCKAKDKVTGFRGIVTAKASYLYGTTQYLLTSKVEENMMCETPILPTELWITKNVYTSLNRPTKKATQ